MANNRSFVVQYLIRARDGFKAVTERATQAFERMREAATRAGRELNRVNTRASRSFKDLIKNQQVTNEQFKRGLKNIRGLGEAYGSARTQVSQFKTTMDRASASVGKGTRKLEEAEFQAKQTGSALKRLQTTSTNLKDFGFRMSLGVSLPMALVARSVKNAARDAEETGSKFRVVFSEIQQEATKTAATFAKEFALADSTAQGLVANTADLMVAGFGFDQAESLRLSNELNRRAADLTSFQNVQGGVERVSRAFTSAMLGEREALKLLGISVLEADVKQRVLKNVQEGQTFASLRQAKAMATLQLIMEGSKNAAGDVSRTMEELANQERATSERLRALRESFGKILMPVFIRMNKVIRETADRLTELSPEAKKIVIVITAMVAALGPLLLVLGAIGLAIPGLALLKPILVGAFTAIKGAALLAAAAFSKFWLIGALVASAALLVKRNWASVQLFFSEFVSAVENSVGPTLQGLFKNIGETLGIFKEAFKIGALASFARSVVELFGSGSDAAEAIKSFGSLGKLIGSAIGSSLDIIIRGLSGMGALIGQVLASIETLDFTKFDLDSIKAEFLGESATPLLQQSKVDVGVNVGLAAGLEETSPRTVSSQGARRADVGALTQ